MECYKVPDVFPMVQTVLHDEPDEELGLPGLPLLGSLEQEVVFTEVLVHVVVVDLDDVVGVALQQVVLSDFDQVVREALQILFQGRLLHFLV